MNRNKGASLLGLMLLILFAAAILLDGKYMPNTSELVTIQIDGIENRVIADQVKKMVKMIEGVQTIFIDEKTSLCTFRYDSGKVNLSTLESQLNNLGIKFRPLKSVRILDVNKQESKLFSIKITPASEQ
ncbi:MAG: hypothetical protein J7L22_10445 [Candidatus Marinimicrobia bacterium]|nr:hypothetical protein [Candidatus Neomarinimicrobiota bacterium]